MAQWAKVAAAKAAGLSSTPRVNVVEGTLVNGSLTSAVAYLQKCASPPPTDTQ